LKWIKKSDGRKVAVAVGTTEDNDYRFEEVAELKNGD
jgi:hypothetical protein